MPNPKKKDWNDAVFSVIGKKPPEDTLALRTSYLENVLLDHEGKPIRQHELHHTMQEFAYRIESRARAKKRGAKALIRAPYNSGKSQQFPIGLSSYLTTRQPETENLIISADGDIASKRILSIRSTIAGSEYKYWCKEHNFKPLELDPKVDTGSTEKITVKSKNRTGNPTFEAHAVLSRTTGQRCMYLWLDDICNDEDRTSKARRTQVHSKVTNTWIKRVHDKGFIFDVCTPYSPFDSNSKLMRSGVFDVLQIAVKEDKTGYIVTEWESRV